jgi:FMN reductase
MHRAIGEGLERLAASDELTTAVFNLAALTVAPADGRSPGELDDDTATVVAGLAEAEAVVLCTPVYRGSMTGVLKNLLDHVPVEALEGKPTAIVAMGGSLHHFVGAERHLRDVLAFFGAVVMPVALYLSPGDFDDGVPTTDAERRVDAALGDVIELTRCLADLPPAALRPLMAPARTR